MDPCELLEGIRHCHESLQNLRNCLGRNGVRICGCEVDTVLRKGLLWLLVVPINSDESKLLCAIGFRLRDCNNELDTNIFSDCCATVGGVNTYFGFYFLGENACREVFVSVGDNADARVGILKGPDYDVGCFANDRYVETPRKCSILV